MEELKPKELRLALKMTNPRSLWPASPKPRRGPGPRAGPPPSAKCSNATVRAAKFPAGLPRIYPRTAGPAPINPQLCSMTIQECYIFLDKKAAP